MPTPESEIRPPTPVAATVAAAAFGSASVIGGYAAYLKLFTFFAPWDDEGYLLVSLKAFLRGDALYDDIYSQYGPFYYEVMGGLFRALGLAVSHDNGRFVTLGLWLAASLVCGVVLFLLTRNLWLGCCVQLLVAKSYLNSIANEPMHPGGLICLLLACLAATPLLLTTRPRLALALQGVLAAGLLLIKINVGVFALIALFLSCATTLPDLARRRAVLWGAAALFVAAPIGLMSARLDELWVQSYAILVVAAALAVAAVLIRQGPDERLGGVGIGWLAGAAAGMGLVVCAFVLAGGTSVAAVVDGILIRPLHHEAAFTVPLLLPAHNRRGALLALAAFLLAASPWIGRWHGGSRSLGAGLLRLLAGGALAATVAGIYTTPQGFLLVPLAWVAAMRPSGVEDPEALGCTRRFLPPLAVLQTLHAYPVAGSQVQWGSFLLVLVAGICIADGARQLSAAARQWGWTEPAGTGWLLSRVAAMLLAGVIIRSILLPLRHEQALYQNGAPLALPGASRLHLPVEQTAWLAAVTGEIGKHCSTFVSLPGMNSFYLWAEQEPPTSFNTTAWMYLFDPADQARIVDRLRGIDRLCLLRQDGVLQGWQRGRALPEGPLVEYVSRGFVPLVNQGGYELLTRSSARRSS